MFICRGKRPRIPNSVSKKKKVGGQTLPDFRTQDKTTVITTVWFRKTGYTEWCAGVRAAHESHLLNFREFYKLVDVKLAA